MEAMDLVARWKSQLGCKLKHPFTITVMANSLATAAVLATIAWIRSTMKQRQEEKQRAEELVNVVLKRLQDQASAYVLRLTKHMFTGRGLTSRNDYITQIRRSTRPLSFPLPNFVILSSLLQARRRIATDYGPKSMT